MSLLGMTHYDHLDDRDHDDHDHDDQDDQDDQDDHDHDDHDDQDDHDDLLRVCWGWMSQDWAEAAGQTNTRPGTKITPDIKITITKLGLKI